jgi:hypothetical protein
MLYSVVGAAFLTVSASAADISTKPPLAAAAPAPAVDGFNAKIDGFGGSFGNHGFYGSQGAFSLPLAAQYGLQIDGAAGSLDHRGFGAVGGHLFWRDPARGLIGIYGSYTSWDVAGSVRVGQVAGEGAWYNGRWTVEGIAGVEFGNSQSIISGDTVSGFNVQTFDITTRFFDKLNVGYYVTDNWKMFLGHRYLGGKNAFAAGTEWAIPLDSGKMMSLFVEGRAGEDNFHGIWGGVKFHFGQRDKSLMARHRQDDPVIWSPEQLFTIINNAKRSFIPGIAPPPPPPPEG